MNKKGFTLVEVIGFVTVLALIFIVAVPSLTKTLKRNEQNKYNDYIDNLKIAAESYMVNQLKEGYQFNEVAYFSLGNLIDSGYVKEVVTNPDNQKKLSRDTRIKVTKELDDTFKYDVQEYYTHYTDYHIADLLLQYDSVEYNDTNTIKDLVGDNHFNVEDSEINWTENGYKFIDGITKYEITGNYPYSVSFDFKISDSDENECLSEQYIYNNGPYFIVDAFDTSGDFYNSFGISSSIFGENKIRVVFDRMDVDGNETKYEEITTLIEDFKCNKNYTFTFLFFNSTIRFYINGKEIEEEIFDNLIVDNDYSNFNFYLNNITMNNVLLYNEALTEDEIKQIYELNKERFGE